MCIYITQVDRHVTEKPQGQVDTPVPKVPEASKDGFICKRNH